jgi:hypothetical protein
MKKNDAGLGMIEVLLAAAMIGGLSLAVMKMNESGIQGVGKIEKRMEIVGLDNEVNGYLGDSKACFNSLGSGVQVSAITGTNKFDFSRIRNKSNVDVFPIPFERGVVKLKRVFLTDYQVATKSARIVKEYHFKSSPQRTEVKSHAGTVAISEVSGVITGCFYRGSASGDGPWVVETNYIYYDNGNVGIGTAAPVTKLDVNGEIKLGNSGATCVAASEGQQRYNSTLKLMEFCDGSAWTPIGGLRMESGAHIAPDNCNGGTTVYPAGGGFMCQSGAPSKTITFSKPFKTPPKVIVTLSGAAANGTLLPCTAGAMDQVGYDYSSVSNTGFIAHAWMSPMSGSCSPYANNTGPVAFSWYAIGI